MNVNEELLRLIHQIPEDASIEEALERLHLLYEIQRGIDQADAGETVPHEQARRRMAHWLG